MGGQLTLGHCSAHGGVGSAHFEPAKPAQNEPTPHSVPRSNHHPHMTERFGTLSGVSPRVSGLIVVQNMWLSSSRLATVAPTGVSGRGEIGYSNFSNTSFFLGLGDLRGPSSFARLALRARRLTPRDPSDLRDLGNSSLDDTILTT